MNSSIAEIFVYPIKSLGGFSVNDWSVLEEGLAFDRQWMLVDENGSFLTQRNLPEMALLKVLPFALDAEMMEVFSSKSIQRIKIPIQIKNAISQRVKVWDDELEALEYPAEINSWFSHELGISCKLVKKHDSVIRQVDLRFAEKNVSTRFSDGFPILVLSQSSLDELNRQLKLPVPINRFRPNIVLKGTHPFEEDMSVELQTEEVKLSLVKPCARCVVTTIDQQTAEKSNEPLKTLNNFRMFNHKILFGMNALVKTTGKIHMNAAVHLLQSS